MYTHGCKVKRTIYGVFQDPLTKSFPQWWRCLLLLKEYSKEIAHQYQVISVSIYDGIELKQLDKQTRIKKVVSIKHEN